MTRAPQELQLHFTQRLSHRTWLRNQRLHSLRQDTEDLHCNRLSSNICRMIMYRLPVREYCVFNKKKCMSKIPFGGLDTRAGEKSYSKNHQDDGLNVRTMHNRSALPQIYSFLGEGLKTCQPQNAYYL